MFFSKSPAASVFIPKYCSNRGKNPLLLHIQRRYSKYEKFNTPHSGKEGRNQKQMNQRTNRSDFLEVKKEVDSSGEKQVESVAIDWVKMRNNRRRGGEWQQHHEIYLLFLAAGMRAEAPTAENPEQKAGMQHLVTSPSAAAHQNNVEAIRGNCSLMAPPRLCCF